MPSSDDQPTQPANTTDDSHRRSRFATRIQGEPYSAVRQLASQVLQALGPDRDYILIFGVSALLAVVAVAAAVRGDTTQALGALLGALLASIWVIRSRRKPRTVHTKGWGTPTVLTIAGGAALLGAVGMLGAARIGWSSPVEHSHRGLAVGLERNTAVPTTLNEPHMLQSIAPADPEVKANFYQYWETPQLLRWALIHDGPTQADEAIRFKVQHAWLEKVPASPRLSLSPTTEPYDYRAPQPQEKDFEVALDDRPLTIVYTPNRNPKAFGSISASRGVELEPLTWTARAHTTHPVIDPGWRRLLPFAVLHAQPAEVAAELTADGLAADDETTQALLADLTNLDLGRQLSGRRTLVANGLNGLRFADRWLGAELGGRLALDPGARAVLAHNVAVAVGDLESSGTAAPVTLRVKLAHLFMELRDLETAARFYQGTTVNDVATLADDLDRPDMVFYGGVGFTEAEDYEQAIDALSVFIERADDEYQKAVGLSNLGIALRRSGDLHGAISAYRDAIASDAQYASPYNNIAYAVALCHDDDDCDQGAIDMDLDDALAYVDRAIGTVADNPSYLDTRGFVRLLMGNTELAVEDLRKAAGLSDSQEIADHLARAERTFTDPRTNTPF